MLKNVDGLISSFSVEFLVKHEEKLNITLTLSKCKHHIGGIQGTGLRSHANDG